MYECVCLCVGGIAIIYSNIVITCNVASSHHVAAFFPCFVDRLSINLMAVSAELVPKVKQPGYLSYAASL